MTAASRPRAAAAGTMMVVLLAAGCAAKPPAQPVSAAQQAACRERADEVYAKQNRAELYQSDTYSTSTRDSPFGNSGLTGITSSGLSSRYARDTLVTDCLNSAAGNVGSSADGSITIPAPSFTSKRPPANPLAVPPPPQP